MALDGPRDVQRHLKARFLPDIVVREHQDVLHANLHVENGVRLWRAAAAQNQDWYVVRRPC